MKQRYQACLLAIILCQALVQSAIFEVNTFQGLIDNPNIVMALTEIQGAPFAGEVIFSFYDNHISLDICGEGNYAIEYVYEEHRRSSPSSGRNSKKSKKKSSKSKRSSSDSQSSSSDSQSSSSNSGPNFNFVGKLKFKGENVKQRSFPCSPQTEEFAFLRTLKHARWVDQPSQNTFNVMDEYGNSLFMIEQKVEDLVELTTGTYVLQNEVTSAPSQIGRVIIEVTGAQILVRGHCFNYEVNYKVSSGLVFTFISSTSLGAARCMQSEPFQDAETDIFNLFHSVDHFEETNALSFMTGNYMKLKATQITTFSLAPHNFLTATISTVVTNYEFYHHTVDCEISFPYYAYGANEIYFGVPDSSISNQGICDFLVGAPSHRTFHFTLSNNAFQGNNSPASGLLSALTLTAPAL